MSRKKESPDISDVFHNLWLCQNHVGSDNFPMKDMWIKEQVSLDLQAGIPVPKTALPFHPAYPTPFELRSPLQTMLNNAVLKTTILRRKNGSGNMYFN
jgi:hypothetical protein